MERVLEIHKFNAQEVIASYKISDVQTRLDPYGGIRIGAKPSHADTLDLQEPSKLEELSIEDKRLLSEIQMALPYVDTELPAEVRDYIRFNEMTSITEAVTSGVISKTYRVWEPVAKECAAYGQKVIPMLEKAIDEISENPQLAFEVKRRRVELQDATIMDKAIELGVMDSFLKVTISPYPDDSDEFPQSREAAKKIGYFTDTRGAMIRIFSYNPGTRVVETTQITVENSNIEAFQKTINTLKTLPGSLVKVVNDYPEPTNILATQIFIPKNTLERGVVDLAAIYDSKLTEVFDSRFFLGREIQKNQEPSYDSLHKKTKTVEDDIARPISDLVETNILLARGLRSDTVAEEISNLIDQAISAEDEDGVSLLTPNQISTINECRGKKLSLEAAAILKKAEMLMTSSAVACLVNPEKAVKLFGQKNVDFVRNAYATDSESRPVREFVMSMVAQARPEFYACGLGVNFSRFNILGSSLSDISQALFGGEGKFVHNCGSCGVSIKRVISKGYVCDSCNQEYKGC